MQAYELRLLDESTGEYKALAFIQGADGKDAFTAAQAAGYTGTEADFYAALANIPAGLERLDYLWNGISKHVMDSGIHTSEEEKGVWETKADKVRIVPVTLAADGWTFGSLDGSATGLQQVSVAGIVADETQQLIMAAPKAASLAAYEERGVRLYAQGAGTLLFKYDSTPDAALDVLVSIQEAQG